MNFFETTNPRPDPEMSNEIRRAVEASYGGIYSQLRYLKDQLGDRSRIERANITIVNSLTTMGNGTPGAMVFVIEDEDWYYWLVDHWEPLGGGGGGGGKPYATVVIAASNSTAADKDSADYVCDGVADEEEINAAIAPEDDRSVELLEGDYSISSPILITRGGLWLRGQGRGTYVANDSGGALGFNTIETGNYMSMVTISDMWISSDDYYDGGTNYGIALNGTTQDFELRNLWMGDQLSGNIYINNGTRIRIDECYLSNTDGSGVTVLKAEILRIANCHIGGHSENGILIVGGSYIAIHGNHIDNCYNGSIRMGVKP